MALPAREGFFAYAAHGQAVLRTTSQALRASSPSRGASGEEMKFPVMPKPPLGRGGGTASAVTERFSSFCAIHAENTTIHAYFIYILWIFW